MRVAAARTGPVLSITCLSELFLTSFFPNTLTPDYESVFPYGEKAGRYVSSSAWPS